ncbi:hypothetical protein SSS_06761 [Sarcoptes scabiei]|uniref:Proton-coupled folate transporter-like protein n=1 Tax=Sarcoptes scabiei TaxID=52283 RepID=A0A834VFQ3_SARSC|nr:hypothetical protein SSS_06761 [Sarcoptes scabiei]
MIKFLAENNFYLFDIYIFILLMAWSMESLIAGQLIQDKLCRSEFNQTRIFCQTIEQQTHRLEKDSILAKAHCLKTISPYYLLLTSSTYFLSGGMGSFLTATNRYIVINTDEKNRSIRFTIFQITMIVSMSIGSLIGGHLLKPSNNELDDEEIERPLRNYNFGFIITLIINLVSMLMILVITIDKKKLSINQEDDDLDINNNNNNNISSNSSSNENVKQNSETDEYDEERRILAKKSSSIRLIRKRSTIVQLFHIENVHNTFDCFFRPRANNSHRQIQFLVLILFLKFLISTGIDNLFYQFTQKVYHFDAQMFANITAISKIVPMMVLLVGSYILLHHLQLPDGYLLVGTISTGCLSNILIGTFLSAKIYLISILIGSLSSLIYVVIKTKISKILPKDEIGKFFSIVSTLESTAPLIGTLMFSTIFSMTVTIYPTLIFHVAAFLLLISLIIACVQDLYF